MPTTLPYAGPEAGPAVDYDLHGFVGIRLLDAGPADVAAVRAQLGPLGSALSREPEITVRFVDRLPATGPLRLLGSHDAAYTPDAFVILRGKHKAAVRVQVPFDDLGGRCEIVCEHGAPAIPLLLAIVNLTALANGMLPLHASAVRYRGRGVLITGWSKGGKTETLLGLLEAGAEYVGDEWVYLDPAAGSMRGIPEPVRVWGWQLDQFPAYWQHLPRGSRLRMRSRRGLAQLAARLAGGGAPRAAEWRRRLWPLADLLERQCYAHLPPREAFRMAPRADLDTVILVGTHDQPEVTVTPVASDEIAARMAFSLQEEREGLMAFYRRFRFAHPGRGNAFLDGVAELESERLAQALRGRRCLALYHPYPPSIRALRAAVEPHLHRDPS